MAQTVPASAPTVTPNQADINPRAEETRPNDEKRPYKKARKDPLSKSTGTESPDTPTEKTGSSKAPRSGTSGARSTGDSNTGNAR
ncbi:MAG: hypothetical protein KGL40_05715 [Rhodocyclaceae bacterium]|nr:hypothetical protein [Rhodocyclaceae bacterium]